MLRPIFAGLLAVALLTSGGAATAGPCRDAKGHFIKCGHAKAAKAKPCHNAKGHFAKCGTPGAK